MARRMGIQYVIWNNRMWRAYDSGRGWTEYNDCLHKSKKGKKAWAQRCHRTHVHFSLSWDGAYKRTSYFSGYVVCPHVLPAVDASACRSPRRARDVVVVAGALPDHQDRQRHAERPVPRPRWLTHRPAVLGRGGVPSAGVAAVVLRVALVSRDSQTRLRVWPAGGVMPTAAVASANPGTATGEVTVPWVRTAWSACGTASA